MRKVAEEVVVLEEEVVAEAVEEAVVEVAVEDLVIDQAMEEVEPLEVMSKTKKLLNNVEIDQPGHCDWYVTF